MEKKIPHTCILNGLNKKGNVAWGTAVLLSPNKKDFKNFHKMLKDNEPFGFNTHSGNDEQAITYFYYTKRLKWTLLPTNLNAIGADSIFTTGITYASSTISSNTTLDSYYFLIRADTSGSSITLTLPAVENHDGRQYKIYKSSAANSLNINTNASETIDGSSVTIVLTEQYDHIALIANAIDGWFTM